MNHIFTVTMLVAILLVLVILVAELGPPLRFRRRSNHNSARGISHLGVLVTWPLLVLVVVLLFYSHSTTAQVTAYTALLATVAGAFAWSIKATKESLQNRAELLISEALSRRPMDRNQIRAIVYADNVLFRLSKSAYIDALNHLLETRRVVLIGGRYSMPKDVPKQT